MSFMFPVFSWDFISCSFLIVPVFSMFCCISEFDSRVLSHVCPVVSSSIHTQDVQRIIMLHVRIFKTVHVSLCVQMWAPPTQTPATSTIQSEEGRPTPRRWHQGPILTRRAATTELVLMQRRWNLVTKIQFMLKSAGRWDRPRPLSRHLRWHRWGREGKGRSLHLRCLTERDDGERDGS